MKKLKRCKLKCWSDKIMRIKLQIHESEYWMKINITIFLYQFYHIINIFLESIIGFFPIRSKKVFHIKLLVSFNLLLFINIFLCKYTLIPTINIRVRLHCQNYFITYIVWLCYLWLTKSFLFFFKKKWGLLLK